VTDPEGRGWGKRKKMADRTYVAKKYRDWLYRKGGADDEGRKKLQVGGNSLLYASEVAQMFR